MMDPKLTHLSVVFFFSLGWIVVGSAMGEEEPGSPDEEFEVAAVTQGYSDGDGEDSSDGQTVQVGSFGQIDIHVKELDITKVLQLMSIQAQRNIVATRNVSGTVSADLYQVDFYEALDALLQPNGWGYYEKGNFIYVQTADEIQMAVDANRVAVSHVYRLNYMNAADASQFVSPLLSANGSVTVTGPVPAGFQATLSEGGENSNAHGEILMIHDYPENVDEMVDLLGELDKRPRQVEVKATILEAKMTEVNQFGVDISAIINFKATDFMNPLGRVGELIDGAGPDLDNSGFGFDSSVGNTRAPGGFKVGIITDNVNVFIRALDQVTDTNVVAKPRLLALNRQPASLLVGQRLAYISTTNSDTTSTQTVEFLDVGTQLSFRAFISDDDFVRMELQPSISDGEVTVQNGFVLPDESTSELTTNVLLRDGQTVVIGGLFKEDTTTDRRQVPFIGEVPIVGSALRGHDDDVVRNEVIFLITPRIMKDEILTASGKAARNGIEDVRISMREGLLPWSRSKRTANYLQRAQKLIKEGDGDKALWNVKLALMLDPTHLQAMRMKEEMTGVHTYVDERSILENSIDKMIEQKIGEAAEGDQEEPVDTLDPKIIPAADFDADDQNPLGDESQILWVTDPENGAFNKEAADSDADRVEDSDHSADEPVDTEYADESSEDESAKHADQTDDSKQAAASNEESSDEEPVGITEVLRDLAGQEEPDK